MRRALAVTALALLLGACGSADLPRADVAGVVGDAFADAGVQRVFIWPVADEVRQLHRVWNDVRPLVATG